MGLLPGALAADLSVALPARLQVSASVLLAGHLEASPARWQDPVVVGAQAITFPAGNLTVCPDAASSSLQKILAAARPGCPQGHTYKDAELRFGAGTTLHWNRTYVVGVWPRSSLAALYAQNSTLALIPSRDGIVLQAPTGSLFLPVSGTQEPAVGVVVEGKTDWYNGTRFAFFQDGPTAHIQADGLIGAMPGAMTFTLGPAADAAVEEALRPFALLDLQAAARGADAREPRSNATELLREYGRVAAFVNGAVLGRLDGMADGLDLDVARISLVRGSHFELRRDLGRLAGTYEPRLAVTAGAVAVRGSIAHGPPWTDALLLWGAAALILMVRRARPVRNWTFRAAWLGAGVLAFLTVDAGLMRGSFGASAASEMGVAPPGTVLALAAFETVLVMLAFVFLALPARLLIGRLMPQRWLLAAEGGLAALWVVMFLVWPAKLFALGHWAARL